MRLVNLFEGNENAVGIIFGRFNPPHMGHVGAWKDVAKNSIWYVSCNPETIGPKDPLPFDVKEKVINTLMPEIRGHFVPTKSWLYLASMVHNKHNPDTLIAYTDESWVVETLRRYNGKEGEHGYYEFKDIVHNKTVDATEQGGGRASDLRQAVLDNDPKRFYQMAQLPATFKVGGKPYFDIISEYLLPYKEAILKSKERKKRKEQKMRKQ